MKTYCGNDINYQFGRSHLCSSQDEQCTSCRLVDAEKKIEELQAEAFSKRERNALDAFVVEHWVEFQCVCSNHELTECDMESISDRLKG